MFSLSTVPAPFGPHIFAIEAASSACALFALSIVACAAFLTWMRQAIAA
jgi:hypothetical protein